jgi:hypothetical protein
LKRLRWKQRVTSLRDPSVKRTKSRKPLCDGFVGGADRLSGRIPLGEDLILGEKTTKPRSDLAYCVCAFHIEEILTKKQQRTRGVSFRPMTVNELRKATRQSEQFLEVPKSTPLDTPRDSLWYLVSEGDDARLQVGKGFLDIPHQTQPAQSGHPSYLLTTVSNSFE